VKYRSKILWLDTETTGTNAKRHDIWQIAYLVEIDGNIVDGMEMKIRPSRIENATEKALEVGGVTREKLSEIETDIVEAVSTLKESWSKYIDKYDRNDKFVMAGYNVRFDYEFVYEMFKKAGDKYGLGSWCFWPVLDVASFLGDAISRYALRFPNYKLGTVCENLGIDFEAHDALEDIRATMRLYKVLRGLR